MLSRSTGTGNTMVLFFSAEMMLRVCRYRSCIAAWFPPSTSAACRSDLLALCSPSAAII